MKILNDIVYKHRGSLRNFTFTSATKKFIISQIENIALFHRRNENDLKYAISFERQFMVSELQIRKCHFC